MTLIVINYKCIYKQLKHRFLTTSDSRLSIAQLILIELLHTLLYGKHGTSGRFFAASIDQSPLRVKGDLLALLE